MRGLRGIFPIAASLGLMSVVTAILWHLNLNSGAAQGLVYIYLFPCGFDCSSLQRPHCHVVYYHGAGLRRLLPARATLQFHQ